MVRAVTMPKLGQSEEEGKLVRWRKKEGDPVAKGDILFEIETDKAVLEVESFFEGTLLKIAVGEGATVPVQTTVGFVGDPGEPIPEAAAPAPPPQPAGPSYVAPVAPGARETPRVSPAAIATEAPSRPNRQGAERAPSGEVSRRAAPAPPPTPIPAAPEHPSLLRISPRAAKLAEDSVIDPTPIAGTGPGGRIVERDVKAYLEARGYNQIRITPAAKQLAARESVDILSLWGSNGAERIGITDVERALAERPKAMSRMRQIIAARLTESYTAAPHFFVTVAVDMTNLVKLRTQWKAEGKPYTLTDFILMAATLSLAEFPVVNSTTDGKNTWWHGKVQLGLAVALEEGLVVPVIRNADDLSLAEIHDRAAELTAKARAGKLTPDEMKGSTFTISNMGMLDVENFTAIINTGESAILAVSSTAPQPAVRDGKVVIRDIMKMTLSSDHRIIDGARAAQFSNAIKKKLEETSLWKRLA